MLRTFRLPLLGAAAAMLALIAVLATLQYRWLGQISAAERERMRATLNTRAAGFAHDLDRELTRAYLTFQADAGGLPDDAAARVAARCDRWQATARYPRMVGAIYVSAAEGSTEATIERFDPATRLLQAADWPEALRPIRDRIASQHILHSAGGPAVRALPSVLDDAVPAIVVPNPDIILGRGEPGRAAFPPRLSFTILVLDRPHVAGEMLPALAEQHFRGAGEGFDYRLAVVRPAAREVIYRSAADFAPAPDAPADAAVDLFAVRLQDFAAIAAEVRRFATFISAPHRSERPAGRGGEVPAPRGEAVARSLDGFPERPIPDGAKVSILVQQGARGENGTLTTGFATRTASTPQWKLLVLHPAGSLEAAVQAARRRNVFVSSGVLALLGASMGLLVLSTRRAQRLAAQQMPRRAAQGLPTRRPQPPVSLTSHPGL